MPGCCSQSISVLHTAIIRNLNEIDTMLKIITSFSDINERMLMDIYTESNAENAPRFFPDIAEKELALEKVEQGFLQYLEQDFFACPGSAYYVLEAEGIWVCALRFYKMKRGLYYLDALETHPQYRNKGYASTLLKEVTDVLKAYGPFRLCDCVDKNNTASLKAHKKCGFCVVSEAGYNYLDGEADSRDYGLAYTFSG